MHEWDKISKVDPDILLDLLRASFLTAKIGKFNKSEKSVRSLVNTYLVFFVRIANTVLNILTVLLDEIWNVELLFRSVKWVWALGLCVISIWNRSLELKGNLSKQRLCSLLYFLIFWTSELAQVCSISGSHNKGKSSWRCFTRTWSAQNESGYLSLSPALPPLHLNYLYLFSPVLLSLSSVGAVVSTVVLLEMQAAQPGVLN